MATAKKPAVKKTATKKTDKTAEVPAAEIPAPVVEIIPETIPEPVLLVPVLPAEIVAEEVPAGVLENSPDGLVISEAIEHAAEMSRAESVTGNILEISIDSVFPDPDQPRKHFDRAKLLELGASIRHEGQLMPVRVSIDPNDPAKYVIEDGERRFRACQLAEIPTIRAIIVPASRSAERLVKQMTANTGEPHLPMEIANGYLRLVQDGWSLEKIARSFGVSRATVELDLKLCDCIPMVQDAVDNRGFSKSAARRISALTPAEQVGAFTRASLCQNEIKRDAAITAFIEQQRTSSLPGGAKDVEEDGSKARKVWGSLKSGFCAFKNTPFSNGKGLVMVEAMKSPAHVKEMEATAKEMLKAAQKILTDIAAYEAKLNQNKPVEKAA